MSLFRITALMFVLLSLLGVTIAAEDDATTEPAAIGYREKLTVTGTRLPGTSDPAADVPAHVTVLDREAIEASGARTLQDLLVLEAGALVHDQVGNGIETTFGLRGFSGGSGTRVFLDGAPINDPRNNSLALDLIPLAAIERVEIIRGASAAIGGAGSEAGVLRLVTRGGTERTSAYVSAAAGSFDTYRLNGTVSGAEGPLDFFISGAWHDGDGFRDNGGGDVRQLAGSLGLDLGGQRRIELSLIDTDSELGNPGALTAVEIEQDPDAAPFNTLDFSDQQFSQATLNYSGPLAGPFAIAANVFVRDRQADILSTGRAAVAFGGFFLGTDESTVGSTVQVTHEHASGTRRNRLAFGVEWLDGETEAQGIPTPLADPGMVSLAKLSSDNVTDRRTEALFVQNDFRPNPHWSFVVGARSDRDRVGYEETLPDPANDAARSYSEISLRAGATWAPGDGDYRVYGAYGEAFLPPTAEQLFAFPTFGSDRDLKPQDSRSFEIGLHAAPGDHRLDVALFLIDTEDEIVFDPTPMPPDAMFGSNVNAGEARRQGLEAAFRGRAGSRVDVFANLTLMDAEFRNGDNRGNEVPLVPGEQLSAGVNVDLAAGVALRADALYVGEQVLDNDDANAQVELDAYTVVNARVVWDVPQSDGLVLFVEGRNLFDESYATRGIFAFDFVEEQNDVFLTPAPGRRFLGGVEWEF